MALSKQKNIISKKLLPKLFTLTALISIASYGTYTTFDSKAANTPGQIHLPKMYTGDPDNTNFSNKPPNNIGDATPVNDALAVYTETDISAPTTSQPIYAQLLIRPNPARANNEPGNAIVTGYDCPANHKCIPAAGAPGTIVYPASGWNIHIFTCIELTRSELKSSRLHLGTIHFAPNSPSTSLQYAVKIYERNTSRGCGTSLEDTNTLTGQYKSGYFGIGSSTYSSPSPTSGPSPGGTTPGPLQGGSPSPGQSQSPSPSTQNQNPTQTQSINQSVQSGSLAVRNGESPSVVPDASAQGETTEPKTEPSPFFDGKTFNPGSIQLESGILTDTSGKGIKRYWPMGVLLIALSSATFCTWYFRDKLSRYIYRG